MTAAPGESSARRRPATLAQRRADLLMRSHLLRSSLGLEVRLIDIQVNERVRQVGHVVRWVRRAAGWTALALPVWVLTRRWKRTQQHRQKQPSLRGKREGRAMARMLFVLTTTLRLLPLLRRWMRRRTKAAAMPR